MNSDTSVNYQRLAESMRCDLLAKLQEAQVMNSNTQLILKALRYLDSARTALDQDTAHKNIVKAIKSCFL